MQESKASAADGFATGRGVLRVSSSISLDVGQPYSHSSHHLQRWETSAE
ncbi:hypothetical protein [Lysinibacillus sp. fls2-241-R2A-57]|nr:hypothetical protein [Lysinibacillus sp. fls2-241-R2A-57]